MKKIKILSIVLVVILITVLISTSGHDAAKYKIGMMLSLSGKSASFGERVRNGIEIALADLKNNNITPIIEDDKGEAAIAVNAANKLINVDGVKIIIGTIKSDAMLAVAPITEKNQIVLFSPTAGASKISDAGDFVFRNIENPSAHGNTDSAFFKDKNINNVAVFIANASNAKGYGDAFIYSFEKIGKVVASTTYNQDESDYRTTIAKVLSNNPQGIYIGVATGKDAGLLVKQLREQGFSGVILTSTAADSKEFFDVAGSNSENTYVSTSYFNPLVEPTLTYNNKYKSAYGVDGDSFSANAYDAVMILSKAIDACGGDRDTKCIRDFLYSTKDFPGVSGTTTFDKNGDVMKPVTIKVAHDNAFEILSK